MAQGFIGASGCMAYLGALKMREGYIGAARVYSTGNIVTYHVDTEITYQEEVDEGASCLSPKTFTPAKTGWEFVGWRQDTTATASVEASIPMPDAPVTLYAVFKQEVTITCYDGSTAAGGVSGYRYHNNGNILNPIFVLPQTALSGWIARGWSTDTAANGSITYANGASFARDSNITLYGMYQQTITVSYSGNGATGGSTAAQTGTRYYNPGSGAVLNPSFSLQTNGFTRSGYTFSKWALGSAGGTQYAAGASITLAASTTVYAVWIATNLIVTGNANYITVSGTQGAELWYATGERDNTAYINVSYAGYRSIKITIEVHVQKPDTYTEMSINGTEVYNKRTGVNKLTQHEVINGAAENIKYRWAGTFTGTKIPVRCFTQNYGSTQTWTSLRWSIVSAELSM